MTTRYEGAGAADVKITILKAGQEIGADVVPEGQVALVFNYDEVFYIQGTPDEVRNCLKRADDALRIATSNAQYTDSFGNRYNTDGT